jgi:hypothetical protein
MTETTDASRVPHNLPSLEPIQSILPITRLDGLLAEGIDQVMLPPEDIEETSLLFHVGIRQSVYMGTHLLDWLCTHPPSGGTSLPAIMIYRHMLDLGDSIGTLQRFHGGQTNFVLLRALFESSLALNFLLQDNKFHEDRGVAYWAGYRIDQLETRLKYDPATEKGIALHALIDADPVLSRSTYPRRDLKNEREELEQALQSPAYRPHWEKYQEAKKNRQPIVWYTFCSDARNLRELAIQLGREAEYAILYSYLSGVAHGEDVFSGLMYRDPDRSVSMHQIRGPELKLYEVAMMSDNFLLYAHRYIVSAFLTSDPAMTQFFTEWYRQFRTFHMWDKRTSH